MRYVYASIMLAFSVIAFYNAAQVFTNQSYKKKTVSLVSMLSVASAIWSLGYGVMFATENETVFSVFRIVGLAGIVLCMIFGQLIIGIMSGTIKKTHFIIVLQAIAGIVILTIMAGPSTFTMEHTPNGIITSFTSSTLSLVYTIYVLIIAVTFVIMTVNLSGKSYPNRFRAIAKSILKMVVLIGIGMIFDTVLPAVGINLNIPASTILQFGGLEIVRRAVDVYNSNSIDMDNMASYITGSIKTPILVFDGKHSLQLANKEAQRFFKLSDEDIKGEASRLFWSRIFGKNIDELSFVEKETVILNEIDSIESRNCHIVIDPIYDGFDDYLGYIMSVNDRTKEYEYVREINNTKEEAERANMAKTQFLANMSHEMRTPLNAILGFSEVALGTDIGLTREAKEQFEDINTSAKGLLSIVNSVLDISKIESGRAEIISTSYDIDEVFNEIKTVYGIIAKKKGLDFRTSIQEGFPKNLIGDKEKIRAIIYNLVDNAIKYTKLGSVTFDASYKVDESNIENVTYTFRVKDTGVGIKEEDKAKIFESFRRVELDFNKTTNGTGLGLSIVKGYVELMNGTISVESEYERGSEFVVEVAQKIDRKAAAETKVEEKKDKNTREQFLSDVKILAVDDSKINLKVVTQLCKMFGCVPDTAISGVESIELAKQKEYDIIFMDQMMPVMDGIEAMQKIRELGNGYELGGKHKIIALTANTMEGVKENMLEVGFDAFLGKPVNVGVFEETIKTNLDAVV